MGLDGRRVVVTRRPEQATSLRAALIEAGAEVIDLPTIHIEPPGSWSEADDSIRMLASGSFQWVIFTSVNAVERFCSRLGCMPAEAFGATKIAAVGPATRSALQDRGLAVHLVPERYTGVAVVEALGRGSGTVLLPRAQDVPPDMADRLHDAGWQTQEVTVYRTVPADPGGPGYEQVAAGEFDVVTFASASAVKGFLGMGFDLVALRLRSDDPVSRVVACIGPITAAAATAGGLRVDVVPGEHTTEGLVAALTMAT